MCALALGLVLTANAPLSLAQSVASNLYGREIGTITVQGLKRIEKDAVLSKLVSKPGKTLTQELVRSDIQAVYGMGFFNDVTEEGEPGPNGRVNLIVVIAERPVISKIEFEGNERLSTDDLKDVTKVKEWSILDVNKVKEDTALIQKHYEEKGFYLAKVTFEVRPLAEDQVELIYKIADYDKVQIKKITFLNNKRFSDDQLKGVLQETREGNFLSFLTSSGNFKESAFKNDLQRLTYFYLDHGYVKFRYENPVVTVSDDKKYLFIAIYVDEGEQYRMGTIDFSGDLLFTKEELTNDLTLTSGQTFSISKRNADIQKLTEKYQDLGYAFANVIPKMNVHDDTRTVDIDYSFEKGQLVHINEINIVGNTKTHDKVIRRELKIHEGELYSGTKIRESRENVERLGFFSPGEVVFNTITLKDTPDKVNLEITVKERSTGTISLGAGYGSVQGFFFTTQVSEINLLGRGQSITFSTQIASDRLSKTFNLGFTDPYALDTKWSAGFDVFYVTFPIPDKYETRKLGFDVRFGHPIVEYTYGYITYKNEGLQVINADPSIDPADINADQGVLSSVVWSVIRDKRNNRFETTAGNYQSGSLETAGLGGTKKFLKAIVNNRFYTTVVGDLVFRHNIELGQIYPVQDHPIPPSERFYLGGPNNLRGYDLFSVGPKRIRLTSQNFYVREPLGGRVEALTNFELEYPLVREAGLKFVTFFDAGNAFGHFPERNEWTVRSDYGFGIRWFSPIGPLRFEWGFPLNKRPDESDNVFQFFIGPPF